MSVAENLVQNNIKEYVNMTWWVCKRLQSWKIIQSYENKKTWKINMRAINLEEKWTTDLIAEIKWRAIWIECKKDKEEYDFWVKLEKRLNEEWKLPKSYHREEAQIREKRKLERRWSVYILTYSLQDFINKLKELWL